MNTLHLKNRPEDFQAAGEIIRSGGLVAFPTETVYGLGANALDPAAVKKIYEAKGRPSDNPLIVHVTGWPEAEKLVSDTTERASKLVQAFWLGPLTILMRKNSCVPDATTAGLPTVALRCPSHPMARDLIRASGCPIAAPSANLSGKPSPTAYEHILHDLEGRVDALMDGGSCSVGVESTILDLTCDPPCLLRPGGITVKMIEDIIGPIQIDTAVYHLLGKDEKPRAPGMKYRHYAPASPVIILRGDPKDLRHFLNRKKKEGTHFAVLCFEEDTATFSGFDLFPYGSVRNPASLSQNLFARLRELDELSYDVIYAQCPEEMDQTLGVENRLKKAAGYQILSFSAPTLIGLTGGSGTGKGVVSDYLQRSGLRVLDCDRLYHQMLSENAELIGEIGTEFPDCIENGKVNTRLLAPLVFQNETSLKKLNDIAFRHIRAEIDRLVQTEFKEDRYVVLDAPTLFESGLDRKCAFIFGVLADRSRRIERIVQRDGISEDAALRRILHQPVDSFFLEHCNIVLYNNDSVESLEAQIQPYLPVFQS